MEITKAQKHQLIEALYLIRECSRQLLEKGVKYWNSSMSDFNEISSDIDNGYVYLIYAGRVPVGTITLKPDDSNGQTLTLGRLAIYPAFQKKGLANQLITFALDRAKQSGFKMVTGCIPFNDNALVSLLEEKGFQNKGIAPPPEKKFESIIFEKML
ncbi:MAG: GNAT family N-acetyltransferase [Bacteroidales bacterium]